MSALGQKQTFCDAIAMSALPPKAVEIADIAGLDEGRAFLLLPCTSNVDLLNGEGIIHVDAKIRVPYG